MTHTTAPAILAVLSSLGKLASDAELAQALPAYRWAEVTIPRRLMVLQEDLNGAADDDAIAENIRLVELEIKRATPPQPTATGYNLASYARAALGAARSLHRTDPGSATQRSAITLSLAACAACLHERSKA